MKEAIESHVHDGDLIYPAGFSHLIPFAAAHEIIRQRISDLTLARATPDILGDQMVLAGTVRRLIFSYAGNPGVGSLRIIRRAIERGSIEIEEYTHFALSAALSAGATGLPFMPFRSAIGSDLPKFNTKLLRVPSPYGDEQVAVVPPLRPDVAIVHVQRADGNGNAHCS